MSLIQRITALAQTLGREIKSLWAEVRKRDVLPSGTTITLRGRRRAQAAGWTSVYNPVFTGYKTVGVFPYGFYGRAFSVGGDGDNARTVLFQYANSHPRTGHHQHAYCLVRRDNRWDPDYLGGSHSITEMTPMCVFDENIILAFHNSQFWFIHLWLNTNQRWVQSQYIYPVTHAKIPPSMRGGNYPTLLTYIAPRKVLMANLASYRQMPWCKIITLSGGDIANPTFTVASYTVHGAALPVVMNGAASTVFPSGQVLVVDINNVRKRNPQTGNPHFNQTDCYLLTFDHGARRVHVAKMTILQGFPKGAHFWKLDWGTWLLAIDTPCVAWAFHPHTLKVTGNTFTIASGAWAFDDLNLSCTARIGDWHWITVGDHPDHEAHGMRHRIREHLTQSTLMKP